MKEKVKNKDGMVKFWSNEGPPRLKNEAALEALTLAALMLLSILLLFDRNRIRSNYYVKLPISFSF